jgi:membrane fusion protein (multidrug efflux system)
VDVATAEPHVLARSLPLSGSISPIVQATVKAKVSGEVQEVTVREGQSVRQGAVIARIDTRNLQAQYDREMAAVEKARADLQLAQLNRDKNRVLLEQRFISQNAFDSSASAYAGGIANLKLAEAQAQLAKINLDDAVIRAPFAGTVSKRMVQPGEKVASDMAIVSLVDLRQMLLESAVPANEIPAVKAGQVARFEVSGFDAREFQGAVQRINPVTTDGSRAIDIYIAVDNSDGALRGGMFAQGTLLLDATQPVLAIPQRAVHMESGMSVVYTLRDGRIERKEIVTGPQLEGSQYIEAKHGLAAGERVIAGHIAGIRAGMAAFVRGEQHAQ